MKQAQGWGTSIRARDRIALFDLDGTLADHDHRLPLINPKAKARKDFEQYHEALGEDGVIVPIAQLFVELHALGFSMQVATGRPERYKARTLDWFRAQGLPQPKEIHMRGDQNNESQPEHKRHIANCLGPQKIWMAIDDEPEVCLAYAELGILALMVGRPAKP